MSNSERERQRRAKRRAAGICFNCPAAATGSRCDGCKERLREKLRRRNAAGVCSRCPRERRPYSTICQTCSDKYKKNWVEKYKQRWATRNAA